MARVIRVGALFWLVLVSGTAFAMFGVKYQVQALEDELARAKRATAAEEHEIRVLDAEWAYLTRPEMLEAMNRRFLSLSPISTKQLRTSVNDIPMRPPPLPEDAVAVAVAEAGASPPAPEGVPTNAAAPVATAAAEPPRTQSALRVMPALLEKPSAAPQLAATMPVKAAVKAAAPRRAKSLDDLIAQITASR